MRTAPSLSTPAFLGHLLLAAGCGSDPVQPELLGRWPVVSITCDCDGSDGAQPVILMNLREDSASLMGPDGTVFEVSAEADGDDCVALGSGVDGFDRDIDATTLCVDTAGDLRGAFVARDDDGEGTWYYAFRHL
jgi:hypothetical protein